MDEKNSHHHKLRGDRISLMNKKIEFYKHNLDELDKQSCMAVLDSLFLTTGKEVKNFEEKFSAYKRIPYTIGVTSCTQALELSLKAINCTKGDEVITTPLSFIATANAIEYCDATPVFVDVEPETGNINANHIEKAINKNTKAILVVHLYGQLCDMKKIKKIAQRYNLFIIEDCAHCIEGTREGINAGELGDFSCYSFYATKNITCGEGGAISCHKEEYYNWFMQARQHGMSKNAADRYSKKYEHYDMDFLGFKCNMSNIQAALLLNQLNRIDNFLEKKEIISQKYNIGFGKNSAIQIPMVLPHSKHARHLYTIWVCPTKRDHYLNKLHEAGIGVAVNFRPIHLMRYYQKKYGYKPGAFPTAEKIGASTLTLPLYPLLTEEEIDYIIHTTNLIK